MNKKLKKALLSKLPEMYDHYADPEPKTAGEGIAFAQHVVDVLEREQAEKEEREIGLIDLFN